jgi:hypothetical protein
MSYRPLAPDEPPRADASDNAPLSIVLIDEFLAEVEAGRNTFTADVIEEVACALEAIPHLMREIRRRRMWAEAARFYGELCDGGLSTRKAAEATQRRLAALGFKAPHWNTIRQTLLRQRIEARCAAGMDGPHCSHTTSDG